MLLVPAPGDTAYTSATCLPGTSELFLIWKLTSMVLSPVMGASAVPTTRPFLAEAPSMEPEAA